jgi:hypothetical protein
MRMVNSLPRALRRSATQGIHHLTESNWTVDSDSEAINLWLDLQRYVNELPLNLQAFVLCDDAGRLGLSMFYQFDVNHLEPYCSIDVKGQGERDTSASDTVRSELKEIVGEAKERVNLEIKTVQGQLEDCSEFDPGSSSSFRVGPIYLLTRARERFIFILAAEEILYALTRDDPEIELFNAWYIEDCGLALRGIFDIQNGRVRHIPPALVSYIVDLPVSRIRECPICGDYFWAGRKDKSFCSLSCGATNRKRKQRELYMKIKLGDRVPKRRKLQLEKRGGSLFGEVKGNQRKV